MQVDDGVEIDGPVPSPLNFPEDSCNAFGISLIKNELLQPTHHLTRNPKKSRCMVLVILPSITAEMFKVFKTT